MCHWYQWSQCVLNGQLTGGHAATILFGFIARGVRNRMLLRVCLLGCKHPDGCTLLVLQYEGVSIYSMQGGSGPGAGIWHHKGPHAGH